LFIPSVSPYVSAHNVTARVSRTVRKPDGRSLGS
jgi:hypothetical protein